MTLRARNIRACLPHSRCSLLIYTIINNNSTTGGSKEIGRGSMPPNVRRNDCRRLSPRHCRRLLAFFAQTDILTMTTRTRSFATAKSTARLSCLVGVIWHFSGENLLIANQLLLRRLIDHESYRIRRNNAK